MGFDSNGVRFYSLISIFEQLSISLVPGTIVSTETVAVNRDKNPCLPGAYIVGELNKK